MQKKVARRINPEQVVYWFFRLNGCSTIVNFVVHPDQRADSQRTDVDVLAVRFPYRAELLTSGTPMVDHPLFDSTGKIDIYFAEVKHGQCVLNGAWTNPGNKNMHRVFYALGAFPREHVPNIANALYQNMEYIDDTYRVRMIAIGEYENPDAPVNSEVLLWDEILEFIYDRFTRFADPKAHHDQWDATGKWLFNKSWQCHDQKEYIEAVKAAMKRYVDHQNQPQGGTP